MDNEKLEQIKILTKGEQLKLMTQHPGWSYAREMLTEKILELQMIGDLLDFTPTIMARKAEARKEASAILYEFISEIEGDVEQHTNNNPTTLTPKSYIIRDK